MSTIQPGGVWTYRPDVARGSNVVGYAVEAVDGRIGKIDKASDEAGAAHLVVDTGFWIFGTKRLIPAGVVNHVDDKERVVSIDLSKQQVESAPDWDEQLSGVNWRARYDEYYGPLGS